MGGEAKGQTCNPNPIQLNRLSPQLAIPTPNEMTTTIKSNLGLNDLILKAKEVRSIAMGEIDSV